MLALISGASSGIGREMAGILAGRGWDLILTARNEERLQALQQDLERGRNIHVRLIRADLSDREACFALFEQVRRERIDLVVNCAGMGVYGPFEETDLRAELSLIDVNVTAVHILTKLFVNQMRQRERRESGGRRERGYCAGRILNVGSSAGFMAGPLFSSYYASKNYVVRLSEAVHEELRREKSSVVVSVLCPGPVRTPFNEHAGVKIGPEGISVHHAAMAGLRGVMRGQMVIVPGAGMQAGLVFMRLLPEGLMTRITYLVQRRKMG